MSSPTGILFADPRAKPLSTVGQFQAGCYLYFYLTGTTTPTNVYSDGLLTTPISQPVTADSAGRFAAIYMNPATTYRVQLYTAGGSLLEDTDPYVVPGITLTQAAVGAALYPQTAAETAASVTPTSLAYRPLNVLRYGADPTGTNDSTSAISSAISVAAQMGTGAANGDSDDVYFPAGVYNFSSITVNYASVRLRGQAYNSFHDGGTLIYPVKLNFTGASGTAVTVSSVNPTTTAMIKGCGLKNLYIECNGMASIGVLIQSVQDSDFENVYVKNATGQAFKLTALSHSSAVEATDTNNCRFIRCQWRSTDTSPVQSCTGMLLTSASPGSNGANVSFCTFIHCDGETYNGIGYILADADNNDFFLCRNARVNTSQYNLSIRGADTNHFYGLSLGATNSIEIRGTASTYFANPVSNVFINLDDSNGTAAPVYDTGCRAQVHFAEAGWVKSWQTQTIVADNAANAEAEYANVTTESLRIRNGSNNHAVLTDGTNTVALNMDGSGNMRVIPSVAAAGLLLTSSAVGIYIGTGAPTISAAKGSLFLRTDGSSGSTRAYINTNGSTTWTNITTAA